MLCPCVPVTLNQPLASSKKVLVQVGTTAKLTGWQTRPAKFKADASGKGKEMDGEERAQSLRTLLRLLPAKNLQEIRFLFNFLVKVAAHQAENKMTPTNLAVCLGPTLFQSNSSVLDTVVNLITDHDLVFEN